MEPQQEIEIIHHGIRGDANRGSHRRQILLLEEETLEAFDVQPGALRENIVTAGVTLAGLHRGSVIQVGEAVLEVTADCAPCSLVDDVRAGLKEQMRGRRGTLTRVVRGGQVKLGDPVSLDG